MPEGIVANLTPEGLADLVAYLAPWVPEPSPVAGERRDPFDDGIPRRTMAVLVMLLAAR